MCSLGGLVEQRIGKLLGLFVDFPRLSGERPLLLAPGMTRLAFALTLIVAVAACGSDANPNAPSTAATANLPDLTTAVINGRVAGGSIAAVFETTGAGAGAGMTVSVEGTTVQSTVNGAGQFVLADVPPGLVRLRFTGAGANAGLTLGTVGAGESVNVTVVVDGDKAALQEKTQGNAREIEGRIESIDGNSLIVAARTVTISAATIIRHGETSMSPSELEAGQRVHVKGTVTGAGETAATAATLILVQNVNTQIGVNLEGTVSGLAGTASAFSFIVQGRTVRGTTDTEFKGGKSPSFAGLSNGRRVHVQGSQQNGFVQASRITLQGN